MTVYKSALSDSWFANNAPKMGVDLARAEFLSNPPKVREERRAKARQLARRYPQSYLARHFQEIYGEP